MEERTPSIRGGSFNTGAPGYVNDFFAREFWQFVPVQQFVENLALTAVDDPPCTKGQYPVRPGPLVLLASTQSKAGR